MKKQDAQAEALQSNLTDLFDTRNAFQAEINQRGMDVLRAVGYEPFKWVSVQVCMSKRGKVEIVTVTADFEQQHAEQHVVHEWPLSTFEALARAPR